MAVYIILFISCLILSYLADIHKDNGSNSLIYLGIVVFLLCLLGGLRDMGVGTDTLIYIDDYINTSRDLSFFELFSRDTAEGYDKGFLLLSMIAYTFTSDYWGIFLLTQLFTIGLMYCAVYRLSKYFNVSYFVFTFLFCFLFYNQTYNYMRQFCALGLLLFAFSYFVEQKYKTYFVLQFASFFFHSSSGLFIIVPLLYYVLQNYCGTKTLYYLLIGYLCLLLLLVVDFYDVLAFTAEWGLYNIDYADRYGVQSTYVESDGFPRTTLLLMLFPFLFYIIAYYKKIISAPFLYFIVIVHFSYVAITFLAFYVVFLQRLAFYFYCIDVFFVAHVLSDTRFITKISVFYGLLAIYCWYNMFILNNDCETYPYSSTILGVIN